MEQSRLLTPRLLACPVLPQGWGKALGQGPRTGGPPSPVTSPELVPSQRVEGVMVEGENIF